MKIRCGRVPILAVDTKNPQNNNSSMYYSTGTEDSGQTTSTSYPFYVDLESSQGLLLGQHVYIEHDTGLSQREPGIWLNEAFIADLDKKPYVWAGKGRSLEKRTVVLGTYDQEMMQYKIEDGIDSGRLCGLSTGLSGGGNEDYP